MAMNNDVYCADALKLCDLDSKYIFGFGTIVQKDSPDRSFGFDNRLLATECIDMDFVEKDHNRYNENKTMDLIMGLADFDDVKQEYRNMYLLPVELKLNCSSFNLRLSDLRGKDEYTRYFINENLSQQSVFIFINGVVEQAISYFNRWKLGTGSKYIQNWKIMNPSQFNDFIKFRTDFPYVPQTDFAAISKNIFDFIGRHDIDGCFKYIENDVFNVVWSFKYKRFNRNEVNYLVNALKTTMDKVCEGLDEFEKEYLFIAVDSILNLQDSEF